MCIKKILIYGFEICFEIYVSCFVTHTSAKISIIFGTD